MKKQIYRAKRSYCDEIVEGQLVWIDGKAHIIRDCDIEECGHHFVQCSDIPTWVDENTIEPVIDYKINEEELDKLADEYAEGRWNSYSMIERQAFKAGYRKALKR